MSFRMLLCLQIIYQNVQGKTVFFICSMYSMGNNFVLIGIVICQKKNYINPDNNLANVNDIWNKQIINHYFVLICYLPLMRYIYAHLNFILLYHSITNTVEISQLNMGDMYKLFDLKCLNQR